MQIPEFVNRLQMEKQIRLLLCWQKIHNRSQTTGVLNMCDKEKLQSTTSDNWCFLFTYGNLQDATIQENNTAGNGLALITTDTVLSCSPALVTEPFGKVTPHYLAKVCQEFLSGCY